MKSILVGILTILFIVPYSYSQTPVSLKLLNEYVIPFNAPFQHTTIGGLSGIDYDKQHNEYYFISDDRSAINPARAYKATISISQKGIDTVLFSDLITFHQKDHTTYPSSKIDPAHTPDPESIRFNPITQQIIWSSEGERIINKDTILENPAIYIADTKGNTIDTFALPTQLYMHSNADGPRQNGVIEGLSFTPDYKTLYASVEEPLYQDGERAGLDSNVKNYCRIIAYNAISHQPIAQYAYPLDAVAYAPKPIDAFKVNGISEILWVNQHQLIVMERSYSTGRLSCTVKLYLTDISKADNLQTVHSIKEHPPKQVVTKKLLLNMDSLNRYIDNIEGICFGPILPNGHRSIIVISDNNFLPFQRTQLLLFEVE